MTHLPSCNFMKFLCDLTFEMVKTARDLHLLDSDNEKMFSCYPASDPQLEFGNQDKVFSHVANIQYIVGIFGEYVDATYDPEGKYVDSTYDPKNKYTLEVACQATDKEAEADFKDKLRPDREGMHKETVKLMVDVRKGILRGYDKTWMDLMKEAFAGFKKRVDEFPHKDKITKAWFPEKTSPDSPIGSETSANGSVSENGSQVPGPASGYQGESLAAPDLITRPSSPIGSNAVHAIREAVASLQPLQLENPTMLDALLQAAINNLKESLHRSDEGGESGGAASTRSPPAESAQTGVGLVDADDSDLGRVFASAFLRPSDISDAETFLTRIAEGLQQISNASSDVNDANGEERSSLAPLTQEQIQAAVTLLRESLTAF